MQKFVPRSRFGIFRNERILSTPLDPNLMFWCLSYYLGAFGTVWLSYESRGKTAELVQKSMQRSRAGISTTNAPDPPQRTLNLCFGAFCTILVHLVPFRCLTKLSAKRREVVQKFGP